MISALTLEDGREALERRLELAQQLEPADVVAARVGERAVRSQSPTRSRMSVTASSTEWRGMKPSVVESFAFEHS